MIEPNDDRPTAPVVDVPASGAGVEGDDDGGVGDP
jgi:hypothetical protein